ncbi:MAG: 3' terminal RNA ribose 2'-O-methyltransferase Hen1, partial [Actinomycetota bacterium]|nr:3' terminal RNA ribose 2'-O-methyltransferase Hen1 [Actinomycetota bacterium]
TTPNAEYNVRFERLAPGALRHRDHRFEWTRAELRTWADAVAARNDYTVRYLPVGEEDSQVGPPTQMAVFSR